MKFFHSTKNSAGIGLIEVLVTAVVISVGLLAVASLQSDLISGSRTNKTRSECQSIANTKIEQLRDSIEKTGTSGYNALASSTTNESIAGVNETFTRNWVVIDQSNPTRKQVSVTVSWGTGVENQCMVQSIIAFDNAGNSVLAAKGGGSGISIGGSTLNAQSSNYITQTITLPTAATPGSVVTIDSKTYIVDASGTKGIGADLCGLYTPFENDLYTRRINYDGVTGNEAIELYEKVMVDTVGYCVPRIRYNGGVIIPLRGIVHSGATTGTGQNQSLLDVNLFTFDVSESGTFCVFKPAANAKSAPYTCYVGGNCQGFTDTPLSGSVTECQSALSAAIVGPGGWRGKVGLLGVASNGRNVCFAEELTSTPTTLDTARNYYARNAGLNEGINKPFSCHDFLIINGQSTETKVYNECVTQANAIGGFRLASKIIQRDISGNNIFDPIIDTNFCVGAIETTYTITGHFTGALTLLAFPTVTVNDGTTISACTATISTYTCNITTSATSVTIRAFYHLTFQAASCNVPLVSTIPSTIPSTIGCDLIFTILPLHTITGFIHAPTAAAANAISLTVADGSNTIECAKGLYIPLLGYSSYICSISTASTTGITINATAISGYAVSPAIYEVPTGFVGGDFNVSESVVPTYTISGSITLDAPVDNLVSLTTAVNTGTGSCTLPKPSGGWKKSTSYNYTCTVNGGSNSLSVAISPTCSNTKIGGTNAFMKYTLTSSGSHSEHSLKIIGIPYVLYFGRKIPSPFIIRSYFSIQLQF